MRRVGESGAVTPLRDDAALVRLAARNNAELCDVVARAHGVVGAFGADAWTSRRRTPRLYPDAVALSPSVDPASLLARIDAGPGASVKDSFAALDLTPFGFRVLFSAEWIHRPGSDAANAAGWSVVEDQVALGEWEAAWSTDGDPSRLFVSELLDVPGLSFLRATVGRSIVAGAIVNRSDRVAGVSNLFASGDSVAAWTGCVAAVSARLPGVDLVGYETGAALSVARRVGFRSVGSLRVWIRE